MLYHGPVRVPSTAKAGKAVIRVELPPTSKYTSKATDISVELVQGEVKE